MSNNRPSIAIVGVSALFPGSTDAGGFWTDILAGVDLVEEIPKSHWLKDDYMHPELNTQDMTYATRGAFIEKVPFDALSWGVPPKIVPATDSAQLLALIMAQRVLNDATQGQFKEMDKSRTSVILGVTSAQELLGTMVSRLQHPVWRKALRDSGLPESKVEEAVKRISDHYVPWQESTFPGLLGNVVAGRIANRLDLGGTNCVTDAACASAFAAVSMAVNELYLGQSDLVITGGVDTMNDIFMYMCFAQTTALSRSGDVKPFSDQADGTLLGEGLGMVALKRLEDAERDGDRIYGLIQGVGSSSDGRSKSVYAPVAAGQANALNRAYEAADYSPRTVELVEAHGTGTPAGDYAEFQGLCLAFEEEDSPRQWCALGSVKSQIGHAKAAAGAAGLFKSVMALHHKVLPPTIKVERPNPKMNLDETPFYLNLRARPWVRGSNHPRRAGVSSFGFGGSNFHIAVEEYSGAVQATRHRVASHELFVMGADSAEALVSALKSVEIPAEMHRRKGLLAWLAKDSQLNLKAAAAHRVGIVASDLQELSVKLGEAASLIQSKGKAFSTPKGIHYGMGEKQGQTAFLFPGQGSQYLDMGAELAMTYPQALAAWDEAADVHMDDNLALHQVVFPPSVFGQEAKDAQLANLTSTQWAQPAIGACSLSQLRLLQAIGVHADAVAGHSYGEVTALHAAGVFDAATMLRVARKRGELMNEAASIPGSMTAVAAEIEKVKAALDGKDIAVVIANHNSPRQVVLSGRTEAIEMAEKVLAAAELTCQRLKVATAFHSEVVSASVAPFAEFLEGVEFSTPEVVVYANSEAAPYPSDAASMRKVLSGQIASPVRFVEQIEAMYEQGVRTFIEVGPHSVLSGLGGRILKSKKDAKFVYLNRRGKPGLASFNDGLAQLVAAGFTPSFSSLWDGFRVEADPRENVLPRFAIDVGGTNVGKPYPPPGGTADLPGPNPEVQPQVIVQEVEVIREVEVIKEVEVVREVVVAAAPGAQMAQGVTPAPHIPGGSLGVQAAAPVNQGVLGAFQEAQRQTMEAHAGWQKAMADTHMAFLQGVEQSFVGLNALMGVQSVAQMAPARLPVQQVMSAAVPAPMPAPVYQAAPAPVPARVQPVAAPVVSAPVAPKPSALDQLLSPAAAPVAAPAPAPAVLAAPVAQASSAVSVDLNALMLKVVADKTGYPAEMLTLAMDLEADLGIDSIKRVEILSAMREEAPSLPEVDAGEMSALRTLGEIVEYMAQAGGVSNVAAAPAVSAGPAIDLNALMLKVVADKTGYPAEMLTLGMDLEADLGIDSIKRVEILSAMREEAPSLPEVDAGEMSALRTLGEIVEYMAQAGGVSNVAAAPAVSSGPAIDLNALMLKVVADKTGYPAEMLTLGMDLEADLGIDSIKRVEILSAMREEAPSLPEVDAGEMSALRTLGEIVEYMGKAGGVSNVAAPAISAAPAIDLNALMLKVVADKTGYPAEMLTLGMDLEADLGIDSIKRVEILSAMREEAPSLPEVDAGEMSALRTLGEIVEYMGKAGGVTNVAAPAVSAPVASAAPAIDLNALMLKVVADKTGYPAEMLTLGMDLEADLGIDSIKRVEILSAMREEAPSLPEVDAGEMSALRTLGEIVEYMGKSSGESAAPAPVASAAAPSIDLNALMLKVVADKTGYPAEMLTLGMDLEADLGIDSIKRVEILSAMREEAPSLPEVDAGEMSALRTLGEIVEYMGKSSGESVSAPTPAPIPSAPGVSRYVLDAVATKAGGLTLPGLDGDILVVPDDSGVAEALVTELKGAGLSVKLGEAVGNERAVIFLAGLSDADGDDADRIAMRAFQAARVVANDCAAFVTVQDTGGDFGLSGTGNPWMGGLAGLAKTAAIEWPNAGVKAIDLQRGGRTPKELAKALSLELLAGGTEREVGLRADGVRLILKSVEAQVEGGEASVDSDSVMLVSGGARGVTAATVISLGAATQASFVLLGRTALGEEPAAVAGVEDDAGMKRALLMQAQAKGEKVSPAGLGKQVRQIMAWREIRSTLSQLAQHGCKARYASVDVTDAAALKALVVEVEASYGPVTGVIHGAGVLADKAIADKTDDQFERVYSTKVNGLRALQMATADSPLRLWVQFSSVAARAGNNGQCDYAMANEVLNKVAGQMAVERPELRVKSMNWGPWEGGMVTPALKARFQAMGVPLIPLAQGAQMLVDEVQDSAPSRVELVFGGEPTTEALLDSGKA